MKRVKIDFFSDTTPVSVTSAITKVDSELASILHKFLDARKNAALVPFFIEFEDVGFMLDASKVFSIQVSEININVSEETVTKEESKQMELPSVQPKQVKN